MRPLPPSLESALARGGEGLSVAVVRLGAMGDIVRVLPAVRLLRFHLPDARIHWVCDDRWAALLRGHRDLDGVVEMPRSRWARWWANPARWPRLLGELRTTRRALRGPGRDLTIDFHGNLRSGIVTRWTGAPVRVGHDAHQQKEGNRYCTTHRVEPGPERRLSRIERHLALVGALGVPADVLPDAGFRPTKEEIDAARDVARAAGAGPARPYAVINPGASNAQRYKQPPAVLLAAAARLLAEHGLVPVILHGPGEREDAETVASLSGSDARVAQPTPLRVLIPFLRGARLFVGGDSGPLHLACGVGCPVVGLYGPTDPAVNAPWNVPSRVVHPAGRTYTGIKRSDRAAGGFEGLEPDAIREAVTGLLREVPADA